MKKSTKALMAGLLIVPAALAMTACGGGEPSIIDTNGDYSAANASSFAAAADILDNDAIASEFDSYRMLLNIDMESTETYTGIGTMRGGMKISTDSIVNLFDGFDMKSILTVEYTGDYASAQEAMGEPAKLVTEQYYVDGNGYMYNDYAGLWVGTGYQDVEDQLAFDFSGLFEGTTALEQAGIDVWIDNNTETGSTKIKMTMSAGVLESFAAEAGDGVNSDGDISWGNADVYYVLQDGKLEGMKVSMSYSITMSSSMVSASGTCKISMQVAKDGTVIEFPADLEA